MKYLVQIAAVLFFGNVLYGQNQMVIEKGTVSFLSSQNVYVKFNSTENINVGDTLYVDQNGSLTPALLVSNKSSSSAVCTKIGEQTFKVGDELVAQNIVIVEVPETPTEKETVRAEPFPEQTVPPGSNPVIAPVEEDESVLYKQKIKGRLSAASYSNISNLRSNHRMRYAFSFRGKNLNNSKFSLDSYVTFRHTQGEWTRVRENIANALKVYSLAARYDFSPTASLTLGRKINQRISSMGALDGLQFEKSFGGFVFGALAGTRPDFADYSFNPNLIQAGAYIGVTSQNPSKFSQTTLGFIEQRNGGNTDRRFVYFQHNGQLAKHLSIFGSFEVDLFENINNEANNTARLTNLYVSLRYRLSRKWRLSASYDNRRNIIYYESYKNFIDQLIEDETRQGLRFGISNRPFKYVSWGLNTSLRFQKSQTNMSRNINGYVTWSKVPFLNARATLRANYLQTDFLTSQIFGIRLAKEIVKGKVNAEVYYRWVDYKYASGVTNVHQNIAGASLNIRILKGLSLYLYYEGVFDNHSQTYHRFNTKLIKRF